MMISFPSTKTAVTHWFCCQNVSNKCSENSFFQLLVKCFWWLFRGDSWPQWGVTVERFMKWVSNQTCVSGFKINLHPSITLTTICFPHQPFTVKIRLVCIASPSHNPLVAGKHFFPFWRHIFAFQGILSFLQWQILGSSLLCMSLSVCKNQSVHLHSCSHFRNKSRSGWKELYLSLRAMVFCPSGFHNCG